MKKITINLPMALLMLLCAMYTNAHDFGVDGIFYNINGECVTVTYYGDSYSSYRYSGAIIIPQTVTYSGKTYTVTTIGSSSFRNCNVTSVTLPNTITTIGSYAFMNCEILANITIPNSVCHIGLDAFDGSLWYKSQADGLIYAGSVAYKYKGTMPYGTSINLKDGTLGIAVNAFKNCSGLKNITFPNSITTIGERAFSGCTSLTGLNIPNSVDNIGLGAFSGCSGLTNITLSNSITSIENSLFYGCTGLSSIIIPNSVKAIGSYAFSRTSINSIIIPESIESIGSNAFYGCSLLTELTFNAISCSEFSDSQPAFDGTSLNIINIGDCVGRIPDHFMKGVSTITSIYSNSITPPIMLCEDCFSVYNSAKLFVPYQSQDIYRNTYYWNKFNKIYGIDADGNIPATGISLNASDKQLIANQTFHLIATIKPDLVTNKDVQWSSGNKNVATVDSVGLVTAIADGTTTITATTIDGTNLSASCLITVSSIPVAFITLNNTSLTLDLSETYQLTASISPSNATNKTIEWKSSNSLVATVSDDGLVTPIIPGNATITATTTDGTNLSASCQVTIVNQVKDITLNESNLTLILPETAQLIATITPSDATTPILTWTSSKSSVATVDSNGFITSVGVGTTTIKATTTDGSNLSASCQVTVNKQLVTSIALNETAHVMNIGESFQLLADITPDNASNKALTWSSGNSSVASVDNSGLVTAKSSGTTLIKASTTDGSYIYANCSIEVLPDYYLTLDTLSHIRGAAAQVVDLPVALVNKNPISGIQFDVSLPSGMKFNLVDSLPDVWLDDTRSTRSHSISASQLNNGTYRILISSSSSKELKGNYGVVCHMNLILPQMHNIGNYSINVSNIIASEADETRHTISNTSAIVSYYYIVGDADANAVVDIADHAATASKILGRSPSPFYYDAANVDGNSSLDVVDLVGITNIALEIKPITVRQVPRKVWTEDLLFCDRLNLSAGGECGITLGMDCGFDFAGFQMDVKLPNGLTLVDATLGEEASKLGLATETMHNGQIRILGTSFTDAEVNGNIPQLLTLKVRAERSYMPDSEIEFSDIIFAERNLTPHVFDGSSIEYVQPSSVYELMEGAKIYVENGNIVIDTPAAGIMQLIAIDGHMFEYQAQVGHNVYAVGANGIYIINFNGKTIKVRL